MRKHTRKLAVLVFVLALGLLLNAGCFGKKGGADPAAAPAAPAVDPGNIDAASIHVSRSPEGHVTVSWKTKTPSAAGGVLGANLFFEGRPLYSVAVTEKAAAPTTDHSVVLTDLPKDGDLAVAVIDGKQDIADNAGRGYVVK